MYVESLNTGHEELFGEELLGLVESRQSSQYSEEKDVESNDKEREQKPPFRWMYVPICCPYVGADTYIALVKRTGLFQGAWISCVVCTAVGRNHFLDFYGVRIRPVWNSTY